MDSTTNASTGVTLHTDTDTGTAAGRVGAVSLERYEQLVARILEIDEQHMVAQSETGDATLEIVPIQPVGGSRPHTDLLVGAEVWLQRLSDDTRIPAATLEARRWVSSRWPARHRQRGVSYAVHKILASINDDELRWEKILDPPLNQRTRT
ncbi:DUF6192 family protein [Nonomuraea sp. NPDC050328]|uniref:DUF6192 family protein n=1 Tax=Nonomuraea sp. NPDC050328 TaxID=3364361 RepID=UPI0037B0B2CE